MGWESERIVVVDGDLGVSGRDTHARESYKELVARVCLGEVGAIFGLEVSRLARNDADLLRLLEFCALTDTLVLELTGSMTCRTSTSGCCWGSRRRCRGRAARDGRSVAGRQARRCGARRAAFRAPGRLCHDEDGATIIDPDQEVQAAIADVFAAFLQTGSAYGVLGAFTGRRFPKRAWGGAWAGELRWGVLSHPRVVRMLQNPCYAGAYVFGRCRSRRVVRPDGTITTATVVERQVRW